MAFLGPNLDLGTAYPDRSFVDVPYWNVLEGKFQLLSLYKFLSV
jgi:hypothetical protein